MLDGFKVARLGAIGSGRKSSLESDEGLPQAIWSACTLHERTRLSSSPRAALSSTSMNWPLNCAIARRNNCTVLLHHPVSAVFASRHPTAMMQRWETELTTASRVRDSGRSNLRAAVYRSA